MPRYRVYRTWTETETYEQEAVVLAANEQEAENLFKNKKVRPISNPTKTGDSSHTKETYKAEREILDIPDNQYY